MKTLNNLSAVEFSTLVDDLFECYFNDKGEYDPGQGDVSILYRFYLMSADNKDETKSILDFHEDLTDDFYKEYAEEMELDFYPLSFASAVRTAKKKVEFVNDPIRQLSTILTVGIGLLGSESDDDKKVADADNNHSFLA